MKFSKELIEKAKTAKTAEELLAMAKAENIALTEEQAAKAFAELNKTGELSDEELDNVVGGCGGVNWAAEGYSKNYDDLSYEFEVGARVVVSGAFTNYDGVVLSRKFDKCLQLWSPYYFIRYDDNAFPDGWVQQGLLGIRG